jgi:hypothetical protein
MKHRIAVVALLLAIMAPIRTLAQVQPVPQLMNFQGRLTRPDGTPVPNGNYSIRFSLWSAVTGGTERWNQTVNPIAVRNGTFAVLLSGFGAGLTNTNLWLEIRIGTAAPLVPRQALASVAYAFKTDSIKDGGVITNSLADNAVTGNKLANNTITTPKLAEGAVTTPKIADGSVTAAKQAVGLLNPLAWALGGNTGTNPATHFLGTRDNQPLELRVNNGRAMRWEAVRDVYDIFNGYDYAGINVIGGHETNYVHPGVVGATIGGGGYFDSFTNSSPTNGVTDLFGTVGGGASNMAGSDNDSIDDAIFASVGGGEFNRAGASFATVAGGHDNAATADSATVGGGWLNRAGGIYASIGGGIANAASGNFSTIAGGSDNTTDIDRFPGTPGGIFAAMGGGFYNNASGEGATVPGGKNNVAAGVLSFAAGSQAKALHQGSFVWADSQSLDFASTGTNQFLLRAQGGVGINTNALLSQLDVRGLTTNAGTALFQSPKGPNASHIHYGSTGDWIIRSAATTGQVVL